MFCRLTDPSLVSSYPYRDSGEWVAVTHPSGALYFYHERLVSQQLFY